MKIIEITNFVRKEIKKLQKLYMSFLLNPQYYTELVDMIYVSKSSIDIDLQREAEIINQKLYEDLLGMLSK